jgi:hypothetical protein
MIGNRHFVFLILLTHLSIDFNPYTSLTRCPLHYGKGILSNCKGSVSIV